MPPATIAEAEANTDEAMRLERELYAAKVKEAEDALAANKASSAAFIASLRAQIDAFEETNT